MVASRLKVSLLQGGGNHSGVSHWANTFAGVYSVTIPKYSTVSIRVSGDTLLKSVTNDIELKPSGVTLDT